jgi:cathepsin F
MGGHTTHLKGKVMLFLALVLVSGGVDAIYRGMVGQPIELKDPMSIPFVPEALKHLVKHYNLATDSVYHYALYNVDRVTSQLVSGIKFNFTVTFVPTRCTKKNPDVHKTLHECGINHAGHAHQCNIVVVSQPWKNGDDAHQVILNQCDRQETVELHDNLLYTGVEQYSVGSQEEYELFKKEYQRSYYSQEEHDQRFLHFQANMRKARLMQMLELGSGIYGMTPFSDLSPEEFRKQKLTPKWDLGKKPKKTFGQLSLEDLPASFDWRDHEAVTPVKNQGSCGSCWAFSTTGNVEGQWFAKKGELVSLSEQELVDCDKLDEGCNGGLPSNAYKEILRLGGLEGEKDYPYDGRGRACSFKKDLVKVYINDSVEISQDEDQIAAWLFQNSPISIGINANAMMYYRGGVSHPWSFLCSKTHLDHGVLIVGYGVDTKKNEPYWIVKNSWGTSWGEKGYYRVHRGDGTCGLNTMCTSAIVN